MEYIKIPIDVIDEYDYLKEKFNGLRAWIDLLLLAKGSDTFARIRGIKVDVKRGQVAKSADELARRWGWSKHTVISFLKRLEEQKRISTQNVRVISLITILEYEKLRGSFENCSINDAPQIALQTAPQNSLGVSSLGATTAPQTAPQVALQKKKKSATALQNAPQTALQTAPQKDKDEIKKDEKVFPTPLPKEEINKEEIENKKAKKIFFGERKPTRPPVTHPIEERKQWLVDSIKKADNGIPRDMLNDFYLYWTETTPGGLKMRFELEKTWVTSMRLARWYKNNRK